MAGAGFLFGLVGILLFTGWMGWELVYPLRTTRPPTSASIAGTAMGGGGEGVVRSKAEVQCSAR